MIPPEFLHELLARTDIVDVVQRRVELKKAGINFKGLCPFHGEKTPSFTVSPARQTYHCFGCGAHGNALDFLIGNAGLGFRDAVAELAQAAGLRVPDEAADPAQRERAQQAREHQATLHEVLTRAAEHYRRQLKAHPAAIDYLKRRGLSGEVARRFGLGYAPPGRHRLAGAFARYDDPVLVEAGLVIVKDEADGDTRRYDRFRDRIMFPIRSAKGEVIGFGGRVLGSGEPKYLNSPETPVFVKGRELYGLYEARQAIRAKGHALVVEGYMDVVALAQLGLGHAVATLGTACTAEHLHKLLRFTDSVVFAFDGDAAGRRAAARALEAALPLAADTRSLRFLFLPPEHDPDSFVRTHGTEAFERAAADAVPLSRQMLEQAGEGCDRGSAEGRARLLANARPLWAALPADGMLRRQLLGELAALAQLPADELARMWQGADPAPQRRPPAPAAVAPGPAAGAAAAARGGRGPLRQRPVGLADQALRLLLLHSDWWERLDADDHELLHQLPEPYGALCNWLERQLHEHGPLGWAALQAELDGEAFAEPARRLMATMAVDDVVGFDDLRRVLTQLWKQHLKDRGAALALLGGEDPDARRELQQVWRRLQALDADPTPPR
ncbi:MAG TPA: DNA primase [Rubrivivax sp.]|nr:DNA primase [Rubrivivax sp.]HRY88113.1 DNA primase [Rubrivivax sp.]HRZ60819.1 DNA primase [Rubrivivax sp.]